MPRLPRTGGGGPDTLPGPLQHGVGLQAFVIKLLVAHMLCGWKLRMGVPTLGPEFRLVESAGRNLADLCPPPARLG